MVNLTIAENMEIGIRIHEVYMGEDRIKKGTPDEIDAFKAKVRLAIEHKLRDTIAQGVVGTYYCNRVWSAWQVGTMSEDDFEPTEETDIVDDLVSEVMKAFGFVDRG